MIQVANFFEAPRYSATAGLDMTQGMIARVDSTSPDATRRLLPIDDSESALAVAGNLAVVVKFSTKADQVSSSTASSVTGDRVVSIKSGDAIVGCERGSKIEFSADLLHSSLDPARAGTTPAPGDDLEIKGSQFCQKGTSGAITTVVGRVNRVFGTNVLVEIVL